MLTHNSSISHNFQLVSYTKVLISTIIFHTFLSNKFSFFFQGDKSLFLTPYIWQLYIFCIASASKNSESALLRKPTNFTKITFLQFSTFHVCTISITITYIDALKQIICLRNKFYTRIIDNVHHLMSNNINLFSMLLFISYVTLFDHKNSTSPSYPTCCPYRISRHESIPCIRIQLSSTNIVFISSQHQILVTPNTSQCFTCLEQHARNFFPSTESIKEVVIRKCITKYKLMIIGAILV